MYRILQFQRNFRLKLEQCHPAGTIRWINVEIEFRTTSQPNFDYISTLFQYQIPAGQYISHIYKK